MQDAFVGRQPIFDQNKVVYAYELLFRNGIQTSADVIDGNQASTQVMLNALTEFGLDNIVGNSLAFINLTEELLVGDLIQVLPHERVVLEILENVAVNEKLIDAVRKLSSHGYIIALDDFVYSEKWRPLVEIADIIKLDVMAMADSEIEELLKFLRPFNKRLLAEKIETIEEFTYLKSLNFDYYQGYFLSKPSIVEGKRTPTNKISILQLLAKLASPDPVHAEIETLITQDVSLSYKILRFINSAHFALPRKIESIKEAILYLGLSNIRRIASMIAMTGFNDQPHEILLTALLRARMCELLAEAAGYDNTDACFTLGLFSALDIMLIMPMKKIVSELPLGEDLEHALVGGYGDLSSVLRCVLAYERQQWTDIEFAELSGNEISRIYLKAVQWSSEAGRSMRT
jgi:EAL and modified HD-GYP domain-containing signal transduction protein